MKGKSKSREISKWEYDNSRKNCRNLWKRRENKLRHFQCEEVEQIGNYIKIGDPQVQELGGGGKGDRLTFLLRTPHLEKSEMSRLYVSSSLSVVSGRI
jgi:hypothetical protein